MGKVKGVYDLANDYKMLAYQFPMGKVKPLHKPIGLGPVISVYQFPMGKVKVSEQLQLQLQ